MNLQQSNDFDVLVGLDFRLCFDMQIAWAKALSEVLNEIFDKYPDAKNKLDVMRDALAEYNVEDAGWDWIKKALFCADPAYEWFYVKKEGEVQAACVTFRPKVSRFDGEDIVYVDYLATAIWNRVSPRSTPIYKGLGRHLLSFVASHSMRAYSYRPGLGLHALPKAEAFYRKIGMTDFGEDVGKESLTYFEAGPEVTEALAKEYK